ncbi:MAG: hypothetical protein CL907_05960 [Dehalococcoidia bacterium]|nr:hypothetical protein [Dehalococcoidia bacterium]|tara:strand:- start:3277 stop:4485 length:1209 start_codon:yes stop_codon:yes gene_type:complete
MEINKLIEKYLPEIEKEFISYLSTFDNNLFEVYLVGGSLRDAILKISPNEIDIAIKGNFDLFTEKLDENPNIKVAQKTEFGTAKVIYKNKEIDIANTRIEAYLPKGSLPKINKLSVEIEKDLHRRDFTINSMAYNLNNSKNNQVIDPNNGLSDLKNKLIRSIHNDSFSDDPTRIFRAIKYSTRLNFNIEEQTLKELKSSSKLIKNLTSSRILNEIKKSLDEPSPNDLINNLIKFNLFNYVFNVKNINVNFNKVPNEISNYDYLILYFTYIKEEGLSEYLNKFDNSKALKLKVEQIKNIRSAINYISNSEYDSFPEDIYLSIKNIPIAIFEVYKTFGEYQEVITNMIKKLSNAKPQLNFNDMKNLGFTNPVQIGKLLLKVEIAKFKGQINTRLDEENFIRSTN